MNIRNYRLQLSLAFLLAALPAVAATTVTVPGSANPYLAGMPAGSTDNGSDVAPDQSPVQVTGITLAAGTPFIFSATGSVSYGGGGPTDPPDGDGSNGSHGSGAANGIANFAAPYNALVGVFLGAAQPDASPAPETLDSTTNRDYTTISPGLKQVFFIGDGLTSSGAVQRVIVPPGATRLFLGTTDGAGWFNNSGSFNVTVTATNLSAALSLDIDFYAGITVTGTVGTTNRIEYLTQAGATNWTTLTNLVLPSSPYLIFDADSTRFPRRIYRAVTGN